MNKMIRICSHFFAAFFHLTAFTVRNSGAQELKVAI
jgi:hypothetical protein